VGGTREERTPHKDRNAARPWTKNESTNHDVPFTTAHASYTIRCDINRFNEKHFWEKFEKYTAKIITCFIDSPIRALGMKVKQAKSAIWLFLKIPLMNP